MSWQMTYSADFPPGRTGSFGPVEGFNIEFGSPDYDLMVETIQGWGTWLHPVRGTSPRLVGFAILFQEANWADARAVQLSLLNLVGTVGTVTLQKDAETEIPYSNVGIPNKGVGEPLFWVDGTLILPVQFIQGGAVQ